MQRKYLFALLLSMMSIGGCEIQNCYNEYRNKHLEDRYGKKIVNPKDLETWEKEIIEYTKIIDEKIDASIKTGKVYRKLGESYALLENYDLCIKNLEKAVEYGQTVGEVFYWEGLCYANKARVHNWDYSMALKAEQSFLKALNLAKHLNKAKYELALIYYAGFSRNNAYRVMNETLTVSQQQYQEKAIELMRDYKSVEPDQSKAYFFLSGLYKERGESGLAKKELQELMQQIQKSNKLGYAKNMDYIRAEQMLKAF